MTPGRFAVSQWRTTARLERKTLVRLALRVTSDVLRGDLQWLKDQALIRIEEVQLNRGALWIAHLLTKGLDVANGAPFPGVARPRLT